MTGGIGSGKSTVCRLFAELGVAVYDSDAEAKRLMTTSLREVIIARFGAEAFEDGHLNRSYLAERVFSDAEALQALNALVHPAVMADFARWAEEQQGAYVVLESAILFEAGLEGSVDYTVAVLAPDSLRLKRTQARDGASEEAVRRRMAVQMSDEERCQRADFSLVNILMEDLEPMVRELHHRFTTERCDA